MDDMKIIVTGGAGFIGSNLVKALNDKGYKNILIIDHAEDSIKKENIEDLSYTKLIDKHAFLDLVKKNDTSITDTAVIFHLGACSDTTVSDKEYLMENNTDYSKALYDFCMRNNTRLIYASSAATYGDGNKGYSDETRDLKPLNYYGLSKYLFDEWVLDNPEKPSQWVGLKFFNVYGPRENHKGHMASVIFHGFNQIKKEGYLKLFKSYKDGYKDGEQKRDFVYVKDVINVMLFFLDNKKISGIYNVGTGTARTFYDLAVGIFNALDTTPNIVFTDMPEGLKEKYQYYTCADMHKLRDAGFNLPFYSLEEGVNDYVKNYLSLKK